MNRADPTPAEHPQTVEGRPPFDPKIMARALSHWAVRRWIGDEWGDVGPEAEEDREYLALALRTAYIDAERDER